MKEFFGLAEVVLVPLDFESGKLSRALFDKVYFFLVVGAPKIVVVE